MKKLFLLLLLLAIPVTSTQAFPFVAGQALTADQLNLAFSNAQISSGTITGAIINNVSIGQVAPGPGAFTTLSATNVTITGGTIGGITTPWLVVNGPTSPPSGSNLAVNTTSASVTITLPPALHNATVTLLDYGGTFSTHNLIVNAPSGANINGVSGVPASLTVSTSWIRITCTYLDPTVGYRCYQ
jgi:hypothetical protein